MDEAKKTSTSSSSSSTITHVTTSSADFDVRLIQVQREWMDLYYKMLGHMAGMAIGEALIIWYLLWRLVK